MASSSQGGKAAPDPSQGSDFITITVPSGKKFAVHAHLLAHHSKYFRRALNSPSQEATTREFYMSEWATEETVSTFIKWIYATDGDISRESKRFLDDLGYHDLLECWLFGDYIRAVGFQNYMTRTIFKGGFDSDAIKEMWDRIPSKSRLRPFLSGMFCRDLQRRREIKKLDELLEELSPTLLLEVAKRLLRPVYKQRGRHNDKMFGFYLSDHLEEM
ncbi:hypothetical protein F5Y13DRAFT_189137 [Hypoxylon sp. FL1857]|nr:hypothetical protein F5Y13DRAFT_189137 [Hypoxylon sp. FL1857]